MYLSVRWRTRRSKCDKLPHELSACFVCKYNRQIRGSIFLWYTFEGLRWTWSKIWLDPRKFCKETARNRKNISRSHCFRNHPPCGCLGEGRNAALSRRVQFVCFWARLLGCCSRLLPRDWWNLWNRKEKSDSSWWRTDRTSLPSFSKAPRLLLFYNKTSMSRRRSSNLLWLSDIYGWHNLDNWDLSLLCSKHLQFGTPKLQRQNEDRLVY